MRRTVSILVVTGMLLVGLLVATNPRDDRNRYVAGSTLAAGPEGTKAFYLLLEELGQKPRRWRRPGHGGLPARGALWLFGDEAVGQLSALALGEFVRGGGTVVGSPEILGALFSELRLGTLHSSDASLPLQSSFGLELQALKPVTVSAKTLPDEVLVKAANGQSVVARWVVGQGSVIALGVSDAARNDRIGKGGNGPFLARLALLLSSENLFDEVQTGLGDTGLSNLLLRVPYRFGVLQILLALALLLIAFVPRRAPAEIVPPSRRRATFDHLDAVARLWSRAKDPGLPLSELTAILAERARHHGGQGDAPFVDWVARVRPSFAKTAERAWANARALLLMHPLAAEEARSAAAQLLVIERETSKW